MAYKYKDYEESEKVKSYSDRLTQQEYNKPADWTGGQYGDAVKQALDKVMNRDKFSYDLNGDMLYKQYKDQYQLLGQQAMMDTIGQAATLTGGYGNSYAQNAGQQAYQGYLQKLNDIVPQLYGIAYDRYNQEGQDLKDQYAMLAQQDDTEYGRYRDKLSDYMNERNYLADMYTSERNFDYSRYGDDRNFDFNSYTDDRNYNYQLGRDAEADRQWQANFDEGIREYEQNFNYGKDRDAVADAQWQQNFDYGKQRDAVADAQWQAEFDEALRQYNENMAEKQRQYDADMAYKNASLAQKSAGSGTTGSTKSADSPKDVKGNGWNNGTLDPDQVVALQKYLGVEADGHYGADSKQKAGGLSADEAWLKYQDAIMNKAELENQLNAPIEPMQTKSTDAFQAAVMTPQEFNSRRGATVSGKKYTNYIDYIDATLEKWANGEAGRQQLSDSEIAYLINVYGL